jgi:hypothetical protein
MWARLYQKTPFQTDEQSAEQVMAFYAVALNDLSLEQLDAACDRATKTCRFFPTPADIRSHIEKAKEEGFELEAAVEWEKLLAWIRENYFPDPLTVGHTTTHIRPGAPWLPAATQHAARAAGGFAYIERCPQDELVWCRKTFLAAYKNVHETRQVEHLLSDGEAKHILAQFHAAPPPTQVRQFAPSEQESVPKPSREEVRTVLTKVMREEPEPARELTDAELAAWKSRQATAVREWRIARGLPPEFTDEELRIAAQVGSGAKTPSSPAPQAAGE